MYFEYIINLKIRTGITFGFTRAYRRTDGWVAGILNRMAGSMYLCTGYFTCTILLEISVDFLQYSWLILSLGDLDRSSKVKAVTIVSFEWKKIFSNTIAVTRHTSRHKAFWFSFTAAPATAVPHSLSSYAVGQTDDNVATTAGRQQTKRTHLFCVSPKLRPI